MSIQIQIHRFSGVKQSYEPQVTETVTEAERDMLLTFFKNNSTVGGTYMYAIPTAEGSLFQGYCYNSDVLSYLKSQAPVKEAVKTKFAWDLMHTLFTTSYWDVISKNGVNYDITIADEAELQDVVVSLITGQDDWFPETWNPSILEKLNSLKRSEQLIAAAVFCLCEAERFHRIELINQSTKG